MNHSIGRSQLTALTIDYHSISDNTFHTKTITGKSVFQVVCFSSHFQNGGTEFITDEFTMVISKFTLRINLSERKADEFYTGGYGIKLLPASMIW
jgi:hypothetical protein